MSAPSTIPPLPLDCSQVLTLLFPYLDRELGPIETEAVAGHLAGCGHCANLFRFEHNVVTFIGERLAHTRAPEPLRGRIAALCQPGGSGA